MAGSKVDLSWHLAEIKRKFVFLLMLFRRRLLNIRTKLHYENVIESQNQPRRLWLLTRPCLWSFDDTVFVFLENIGISILALSFSIIFIIFSVNFILRHFGCNINFDCYRRRQVFLYSRLYFIRVERFLLFCKHLLNWMHVYHIYVIIKMLEITDQKRFMLMQQKRLGR